MADQKHRQAVGLVTPGSSFIFSKCRWRASPARLDPLSCWRVVSGQAMAGDAQNRCRLIPSPRSGGFLGAVRSLD